MVIIHWQFLFFFFNLLVLYYLVIKYNCHSSSHFFFLTHILDTLKFFPIIYWKLLSSYHTHPSLPCSYVKQWHFLQWMWAEVTCATPDLASTQWPWVFLHTLSLSQCLGKTRSHMWKISKLLSWWLHRRGKMLCWFNLLWPKDCMEMRNKMLLQ